MHGHAEANKMMAEADCVLTIGTRFSDRSVGTFEAFEKTIKNYSLWMLILLKLVKIKQHNLAVVGDVT